MMVTFYMNYRVYHDMMPEAKLFMTIMTFGIFAFFVKEFFAMNFDVEATLEVLSTKDSHSLDKLYIHLMNEKVKRMKGKMEDWHGK